MHSSSDYPIGREAAPGAEPPRAEPEIIPPGADFPPRPQLDNGVFAQYGTRIHLTRLGPFGIAFVLLGAGILGAVALLMLLGAALVGAAAAGVIIVGALVARLFRGLLRP